MRIVVAPQEFKGTLTAAHAAEAIAKGVRRAVPEATIDQAPLSDGGPGLVDAVLASRPGRRVRSRVQDPLGRPLRACWALLDEGTAVIEMAAAAGLVLLPEAERDPRITSTYGVGQLIGEAVSSGARRIVVGVGGSATNDGGAGMAAALGARLLDADGNELPPGGAALIQLARIDISGLDARLHGMEVIAATDVRNPLCGPEGASAVYGPQKGASPDVVRELDSALEHYSRVLARDLGVHVRDLPGAGAAGGLGSGLIAFLGADVRSGFDIVAEVTSLRERLRNADLLVTGEGRLDRQTAYGKTVARAAAMAREEGVPTLVVAGSLGDGWEEVRSLVDGVEVAGDGGPSEAVAAAAERGVTAWAGSIAGP
ncbi:MAG TPA: glycerate kinase [Dehalococcoidia bacterium]|nr:glycerate kinase [Dehalococcoidia bacterium]